MRQCVRPRSPLLQYRRNCLEVLVLVAAHHLEGEGFHAGWNAALADHSLDCEGSVRCAKTGGGVQGQKNLVISESKIDESLEYACVGLSPY